MLQRSCTLPSLSPSAKAAAFCPAGVMQGLALLESLHAALGLVRGSPVMSAAQWAGRAHTLYLILEPFPQVSLAQSLCDEACSSSRCISPVASQLVTRAVLRPAAVACTCSSSPRIHVVPFRSGAVPLVLSHAVGLLPRCPDVAAVRGLAPVFVTYQWLT